MNCNGQPSDVVVVPVDGREFILVGTAHISRESAHLVREVIERERPERVCVEIDRQRYEALAQGQRFESLDLRQVIRQRQLGTLILNLILASYQKQLGGRLGVQPGAELLEAVRAAEGAGVPVSLCDRDVRVTLRRAWAALSLWRKIQLCGVLMSSLFEKPELTEDDLRELRRQDVVSKLMLELGEAFPALKAVLIDERDAYLTQKMRQASGKRIVGVVGAGHVDGVRRALLAGEAVDVAALERIPPASVGWKWVGWGIPLIILGAIAAIGVRHGAAAAGENMLVWVLANGIPTAIGALLALAHPATVVVAFVAAPITSLTPVIGAGYVAAFVQAYLRPPIVRELRGVWSEITSPVSWWRNSLLRIFLVFLFTTLGSIIGTIIGATEIVSNLF